MYNTDDYFVYNSWDSPASQAAQEATDYIWDDFKAFLEAAHMGMTSDSEWSYSCQCNGIEVYANDHWNMRDVPQIDEVSSDECDEECWLDVYSRHYPRIKAVFEWIERTWEHLEDCPTYEYGFFEWSYVHRRDEIKSERLGRVIEVYKGLVDDLCDEIASECTRRLNAACDYAYSQEAAEEWAREMNDAYPDNLDEDIA